MKQIGTNLVYTTKEGEPVISHTYEFTGQETEVIDLRTQIMEEEGESRLDAAFYAQHALARPDVSFIEWFTDGVLSLDADGRLIARDEATMEWLKEKQAEVMAAQGVAA